MNIQYSPEAIEDLIRLREFIEIKNPNAASRIAKSLKKGISQLMAFPYLGLEVEMAPDPKTIRDLIIGSYVARYLIHTKDIYILRVWHQKENRL